MWVALKLLEGDELLRATAQLSDDQRKRIRAAVESYVRRGQAVHPGIDSLTLVVVARYRRSTRSSSAQVFVGESGRFPLPTRSTGSSRTRFLRFRSSFW